MTNRTLPYVNAYGTVDISTATNVEEALNMSGLNWDVVPNYIYDANGNMIEGFRANTNSETGDVLGITSKKYHVVQNREAFEFVNNLTTDTNFKFDSAGCFRNGKSIWLMGHLDDVDINGDEVNTNIVFVNSHDGSSGVKVLMTPTRVICSNMLNLATRQAERSWKSRHTVNFNQRYIEAANTFGLATNYINALKEEADILAQETITLNQIHEIFEIMFPVNAETTERKLRTINEFKDNFMHCYNAQDLVRFRNTKWGAVNAMADLIDHKEANRRTENYYSNHWNNLINGESHKDEFYRMIKGV